MDQAVKNGIVEKVKELILAPSCCKEAKAAAESWLGVLGTDREAEQAKNLVAELEMDIMPVDGLIAFADSEVGAQVFGQEMAKKCGCPRKGNQGGWGEVLRLPCLRGGGGYP